MLTHTHLEEEEKLKCECVQKNKCVSSFARKVFEVDEKVVGPAELKDGQSRRQKAHIQDTKGPADSSIGVADSQKVCLQSFEKSDFESAFPALKGSADDSGVVRSMISAIERKSDSGSSSGGIGALEQSKTAGMGRIIGASASNSDADSEVSGLSSPRELRPSLRVAM